MMTVGMILASELQAGDEIPGWGTVKVMFPRRRGGTVKFATTDGMIWEVPHRAEFRIIRISNKSLDIEEIL